MKRGTADHPKVWALMEALDLEPWGACGILELLWHFVAKSCPRGDVGKFADKYIARGIGWSGDARKLISALVECGWLDASEEHRLIVHDWPTHADDAVHRALGRAKERFADGTTPRLSRLSDVERLAAQETYSRAPAGRTSGARQKGARRAHVGRTPGALLKPEPRLAPPSPAPPRQSHKRASKGSGSPAPEALDDEGRSKVLDWLSTVMPGDVERVDALIERTLDYHRAQGNQFVDWPQAVINAIRNYENAARDRRGEPPLPTVVEAREIARRAEALRKANEESRVLL